MEEGRSVYVRERWNIPHPECTYVNRDISIGIYINESGTENDDFQFYVRQKEIDIKCYMLDRDKSF